MGSGRTIRLVKETMLWTERSTHIGPTNTKNIKSNRMIIVEFE